MKKIINILLTTLVLTSVSTVSANAEGTYERICAPHGWAGCGEFVIYDSNGVERNRVIGPISILDECGVNLCGGGPGGRAVLTTTIKPEPIVRTEVVAETTLTATVNVETKVVAPNSDGSIGYKPGSELISVIDSNTSATISASETRTVTTLSENNTEIISDVLFTETKSFDTRQTRSQIQVSVENKLRIIQQYLNRFYVLLNGWIID